MKITKDVINDLLPVYLAGEASADTRALLEEYLRSDPALAAEARAQAEKSAALLGSLGAAPPPDLEVATFDRIRRYNRYRNQFFAFGLAFALLPFAFAFANGSVTWFMLRDSPKQAVLFLVASAYCWISRAVLGRQMRSS